MRPTPAELIDAIAFSLKTDIAEELQSGWAKRILSSTLSALEYLKLRSEHYLDILADDNADLAEALEKIDRLIAGHPSKLKTRPMVDAGQRTTWAEAKPSMVIRSMEAENRGMRQALVEIQEQLDTCGAPELATQIRTIVHPYIQRQLARKRKLLVPYTAPKE